MYSSTVVLKDVIPTDADNSNGQEQAEIRPSLTQVVKPHFVDFPEHL